VSLRAWAKFLKDRRELVINHLVESEHMPREKAGQQLQGLLWVLELLDRLEVTQRTGAGQVTWTLAVKAASPKN
jgi:hypothetical protein